jgi:autotransporter translocation and assembly factor TamB
MRVIRRFLQVVALVGTLMIGVLAAALIVSQTPWFRDWLRRYVVRESKQYLNGDLTIGGLGGNLLFGVNLADVTVDVSGQRVIAVKGLTLDYSVFELISTGLVLDGITIDRPVIRLERDGAGWNLSKLVKRERREADREGPRRPVSLPSIRISDARVSVLDRVGSDRFTLPKEVDGVDVSAAFEYAPVHYSVTLQRASFRTASPSLSLNQLSGRLAVRDDNLHVEDLRVKTPETSMTWDGVIENYLTMPVVKVTGTGQVSLPEIGRVLPSVRGYQLHPVIDLKADGPADRLGLDLDVRSEAGRLHGRVTADVRAPDFKINGDVDVERLNLAPIAKSPAYKTDLTGHAVVNLAIASGPSSRRIVDRMSGSVAFRGPSVTALGYRASNVSVTSRIAGPKISIDGRAAAYGGTATATGVLVMSAPGRPFAFDLRGKADHVDVRRLPASTGAPRLETDLGVSEYHVRRDGASFHASATLRPSTVEGARFSEGTAVEVDVSPREVAYRARGSVSELNLERMGRALGVPALADANYDSRLSGPFDVAGQVLRVPAGSKNTPASALERVSVDATGVLEDSEAFGGRFPDLAYEAHLDRGALTAHAKGRFEDVDPARMLRRSSVTGSVKGTVDATVSIADLGKPLGPEDVTAEGMLTLDDSNVRGLELTRATIEGSYRDRIGDIARATVEGPDVKADASGRLALDREGQSNLKYRVDAVKLDGMARLAGQSDIAGSVVLEGTIEGNAATLKTTGTLKGNSLSYRNNTVLALAGRYTVTLPELALERVQVESTADGTFVDVAGLHLNSLHATTTYADKTIQFTTNVREKTREVDATGTVILHPDHQEIHLPQLTLRTQGVEWTSAPGSSAAVQYGRGRIDVSDLKLVSGDQALDVSGSLALAGAAPVGAIDVHARRVDLQQLEAMTLQNRGFTGRLNADATIAGAMDAPDVRGHFQVDQGGFGSYRYDSLTADVDYRGARVGIDATLQQGPDQSITARGTVPTTLFSRGAREHVEPGPGDEIDLKVTSTALGLGLIQGFTSAVTGVGGTLQADVHVGGSGRDPHVTGFIDIANGSFAIPSVGESFTGLTTRIDLSPDLVRIQRFQLLDRHGEQLTVAGELAVHERRVGSVNVSIDSGNFEIVNNELGDVQVRTALKVTGELLRPRIVGDVRLDAARLEVDRILQLTYSPYDVAELPDVVSAERTVAHSGGAEEATKAALAEAGRSAAAPETADTPAPTRQESLFDAVALDVHLIIPDNLVLRGKDLRPGGPTGTALGDVNITVGGDVHVRKESGEPLRPVGTVTTVRGTYDFQGRRFDLVRGGTIRFVGTQRLDPLLDVSAARTIPGTGVEARVRIEGTPASPRLTLTSDPPLEQSDILSLIVFNRPVNELGTGERSSLAATAGGIATGFIAAPLGESIAKALDVDLFEITTSTDSGELGAVVTVGQQIGDRAFVKLRQQFTERSVTEFMIEYQLARFLRLQATAAPEASNQANRVNQRRVERGGIDLIFFFSY